jgi:hypothetical protein
MKNFTEFLNEFEIEGEHQDKPLWNGKDYLTPDGHIDLNGMNLTELPCIFPEEIQGNFWCYENKLTSLHGCPKIINGDFMCYENELINLSGGPTEVKGDYNCSYNKLTSLQGAPREIGNWFDCSDNKNLEDLTYFPKIVRGSIIVEKTKLNRNDVKKVCAVQGAVF